jgi:hypothetical protein
LVTNSEGSDVGSVQNSIQIKKINKYWFGDGIIHTTGVYSDEEEEVLLVRKVWFCFLMEHDLSNSLTSFCLKRYKTIRN